MSAASATAPAQPTLAPRPSRVNDPPTVTVNPVSQTVDPGDPVSFTIAATGTAPLDYQWYKGASPMGGETSTTLAIASATEGDEGDYQCKVTNSAGEDWSTVASLSVNDPPAIVAEPQSLSLAPGQTATFIVGATGTEPLSYLWYKNGAAMGTETETTPDPRLDLGIRRRRLPLPRHQLGGASLLDHRHPHRRQSSANRHPPRQPERLPGRPDRLQHRRHGRPASQLPVALRRRRTGRRVPPDGLHLVDHEHQTPPGPGARATTHAASPTRSARSSPTPPSST